MENSVRNKQFGQLLTQAIVMIAAYEEKNISIIQDEIGNSLRKKNGQNYHGGAIIEHWRKGHLPPNQETLRDLAKILAERRGLDAHSCEKFLRLAGEFGAKEFCAALFSLANDSSKQEADEIYPPDPPAQEETKSDQQLSVNTGWNQKIFFYAAAMIALTLAGVLGAAYYWPDHPIPLPPKDPATGYVLTASYTDQAPEIDGRLDDQVWMQAIPLLFAKHPTENGSSTATVKLLWDNQSLYAAFDVSDTQVEGSEGSLWDGDSVSLILNSDYINNERKATEYRHTIRGKEDADRRGTNFLSKHLLTGNTTYNDPTDDDIGYSIEMRIPWLAKPDIGAVLKTDLLSVDHDNNPGAKFDDFGTIFSKIFWDNDATVDKGEGFLILIKH